MHKKRGMKWNSFYQFWTAVSAIWGTLWCMLLALALGLCCFGSGLLDSYLDIFSLLPPTSQMIDIVINLLIRLLASGLAMMILSYLAISSLNRNNRAGLVRINLQSFMAALTHLLKFFFFWDAFNAVDTLFPGVLDDNTLLGFYAVLCFMFLIRFIIFIFNLVYFYKRKRA